VKTTILIGKALTRSMLLAKEASAAAAVATTKTTFWLSYIERGEI
jgi:hypothetical protein